MHTVKILIATAIATFAFSGFAAAEEFEVKMLNKGEAGLMVFEPSFVHIQLGDTVHFISTDRGHNAQTIKDLIPADASSFKGALSEDTTVTFDVEGAYAIKCLPHLAMGMVAVVVVGDNPTNLSDLENARLPRKARQRMDDAIAQL